MTRTCDPRFQALSNGGVGAVGVRALFEWWLIDSAVTNLELAGHVIGDGGAEAAAEWLPDTRLQACAA